MSFCSVIKLPSFFDDIIRYRYTETGVQNITLLYSRENE